MKLDTFLKQPKETFAKIVTDVSDMSDETFNGLDSTNMNLVCPHCSSYLECNLDFFIQHTDMCLKL